MDNNEPAAFMEEAEEADQDEEWLSVGERLKLMTKRENTKKGDENAEATQAPKRTSMARTHSSGSIADKIAKIQGSGSAEKPAPPPVERLESIPKKGNGIAERLAKLDPLPPPPVEHSTISPKTGDGIAERLAKLDPPPPPPVERAEHPRELGAVERLVHAAVADHRHELHDARVVGRVAALGKHHHLELCDVDHAVAVRVVP